MPASAPRFSPRQNRLGQKLDLTSDVDRGGRENIYRNVTGKRPLPIKVPLGLRLSNAEAARQYVWNNEVRWRFPLAPLQQQFPFLTSFESFQRQRLNTPA